MNNRTRTWLPAAMLLIAMLAIPIKTAHASGWTVTYTSIGTFTDSTGPHPWPLLPVESANCGFFVQLGAQDSMYQCFVRSSEDNSTTGVINSGTITPHLHWNRDLLPDLSPDPFDCPPATADVLLSIHAWALPYDATRHDNITDSFHDPEMRNPIMGDVMLWADHPVHKSGIAPSGNDDVALDPVTITSRSILPGHMPNLCNAPIEFKASVFHMDITGTSTDGTSGPPPRYFSGTNCNVTGTAFLPEHIEMTDGPKGFASAVLWIDNQWANAVFNEKPYPSSVSVSAVFDSTHFHDDAQISMEVWAKDDKGKWYTYSKIAHSYNKALVLRTAQEGALVTDLRDSIACYAQDLNHSVCPTSLALKDELLGLVPTYTLFYMVTHGDTWGFGDQWFKPGDTPPEQDDAHWISYVDIAGKLADPSYPTKPSYNFVMFDACNCAGDDNGPSHLLQYAFGIPSNAIDRAFLGWDAELDDNPKSHQWTKMFWAKLAAGNTVTEAMMDASVAYHPVTIPDRGFPRLYGDYLTKLHGVYRPYGVESLDWKFAIAPDL